MKTRDVEKRSQEKTGSEYKSFSSYYCDLSVSDYHIFRYLQRFLDEKRSIN